MGDSAEVPSPASVRSYVEIEEEPAHKIIFENEYVRSYYAELPPGHVTLFHCHHEDTYTIFLEGASIREEIAGSGSFSAPRHVAAFAGFCKHFKSSPVVHRIQAESDNKVPAPILAVEIRCSPYSTGQRSVTSKSKVPLDTVPGYALTEEGAWDKIRVYTLSLFPGQRSGPHDFDFYGVVLFLTDGCLEVTEAAGTSPFPEDVKKGMLRWFEPTVTHDIRNRTYMPFRAVVLELL